MTTITEFLLARISEDEAVAGRAEPGPWFIDTDGVSIYYVFHNGDTLDRDRLAESSGHDAIHIARYDPARILGDCAAKRAIVALSVEATRESYVNAAAYLADALQALAVVYADHPDYQPEWVL